MLCKLVKLKEFTSKIVETVGPLAVKLTDTPPLEL